MKNSRPNNLKSTDLQWKELGKRKVAEGRVFDMYARTMQKPCGTYESDFFVLESRDWCNIVALTPKHEVVLVEQFRHGTKEVGLELPGGIIDPGESDPLQAALRELEEESGYVSDQVCPLGVIDPNPAIQTNRCHLFVGLNAEPKGQVNLDPAEAINVHLVPLEEMPSLICGGRIRHALMVAAFCHFLLRRDLWPENLQW